MYFNQKFAIISIILVYTVLGPVICKKHDGKDKPDWAKKNILDYSEADMERLLDQWEVSSYINIED